MSRINIIDRSRQEVSLSSWFYHTYINRNRTVKENHSSLLIDKSGLVLFSVDGYCQPCETAFEADGCFFHFCACQDHKHHSEEEELKRGLVRRGRIVKRKQYL